MLRFFIHRPIFAAVCSLLIVLAGGVSIPGLAVAQYPQLAPPRVTVTASYVGAGAQLVETTVTTPLEEQINGADGMAYMSSVSTNGGLSQITVTFDVARDPDLALFDVQNRVNQALARLPGQVRQTGVTVTKASTQFVLALALYDVSGAYDPLFLSNYADVYLVDALRRIPGVGDVRVFGERKYSMRIWLDPARLAARRLTATDVVRALEEQNVEVASGQLGQPPAVPGQSYVLSVRTAGQLTDARAFEDVVLKTSPEGAVVRLGDVGRAELGAEDYSTSLVFDGRPAVGLGVLQLPSANALDVGRRVLDEMARLSKTFPPGLRYETGFDTTTFVRDSVVDVVETLGAAIALVIAVMFVFLASARATLIPAITIPVSLVGTFFFVRLFAFSINTLTLFGIVLATGLVVDDAIVVIENIQRFMHEKGMHGRDAALAAMREVAGAVVATSLVLVAVFVPVAFFPGTTGRIYKQFSLTIAFSVAISAFNALTLTPALSALVLRSRPPGRFGALVERLTTNMREGYCKGLARALRHPAIMGGVFLAALALTFVVYRAVPTGFVPEEDQGYFVVSVQGPDGASLQQTERTMAEVREIVAAQPEVAGTFSISGFNFNAQSVNAGLIFVPLKPYSRRHGSSHSAAAVIERVRGRLMGIPQAIALPFPPPAIQGVGALGGFQFELLQEPGGSPQELAQAADALVGRGRADPSLRGLFTAFTANAPQLEVDVDRQKAKALGLRLDEVFGALGVYVGSAYVDDFTFADRAYRVYVQAEAKDRAEPRQLDSLYARSDGGQMVPLGAVLRLHQGVAPAVIDHYDLFRSAEIDGSPSPRASSGQAIRRMEALARETLPAGMHYAWTGLALEQIRAGATAALLFALGIVVVFLVLAAQYESFSLPFIVLLGVPIALLGALAAQALRGQQDDVFCQVGLLMLVGLASKNAILIVEFARRLREGGASTPDAVLEAARIRLRPILMTSFAFILGVLPLVFASGAGSASRHSLGTAVFGGMIVSTLLNLFIVPTLYVLVESSRERLGRRTRAPADAAATP